MSNKSRQGIRPAFLAAVLGVVAMLAVVAVLTLPSGLAHAQANPFAPPAPTDVNAAANSDGTEVTVTWTAGTGGAPASGYEVERKVDDGAWMSADPAHTGTMASYADSTVSGGMTYAYRVRATNSFGFSVWVESNAVTVIAPDPQLDPPADIRVAAAGVTSLEIAWDAVAGASGYRVEYMGPGDNAFHVLGTFNATTVLISGLTPDTRYTVQITALGVADESRDSEPASIQANTAAVTYGLTVNDVENLVIKAAGRHVIRAEVTTDSPAEQTTVAVRIDKSDGTMHLDDDPGITYTQSGLRGIGERSEDVGNLVIDIRDDATRVFTLNVTCSGNVNELRGVLDVEIRDDQQQLVAAATVTCEPPEGPPPPDDQITASECYSVTGYMGDDEGEAMDLMRDDIEPYERPADPTNPEMGQDTIQILEGSADVQITVTACEPGPVYIRFLDSNGDVFGTDVDECETCEGASGADVVGLDSQQKLELNLSKEMGAAMALMYDQYNVVTPGDGSDMYLAGKLADDGSPLMYYQGKFRFMAPCDWEPFQIEVYEKNGKVQQQLQNGMMRELVTCVPPEEVEAQPISVTQGSRDSGEMIVEWEEINGAVEYTVAVLDTSNSAMYTVAYAEMFDATATRMTTVTGLTSGTRYIFAVYAELADGSYSPVEFVINTPEFTQQ